MKDEDLEPWFNEDINERIRFWFIVVLFTHFSVCLIMFVVNYSRLKWIVDYLKHSPKKGMQFSDDQWHQYFLTMSLFAQYISPDLTEEQDEKIIYALNQYYRKQIRKMYLFNIDPKKINWSSDSTALLGYLLFKYAKTQFFDHYLLYILPYFLRRGVPKPSMSRQKFSDLVP